MTDHTRELTYPAVVRLLEDGKWHASEDLEAVTFFPSEWIREVEREHPLERRAGAPELIRLRQPRRRLVSTAWIRFAVLLATLPIALVVGSITGSDGALLAVLAGGLLASSILLLSIRR